MRGNIQRLLLTGGGTTPYYKRIKNLFGANLIAYWTLGDLAGSAAIVDTSGNAYNGTAANITFGEAGIGDGKTAASFNGTSSQGVMIGAGLTSKFNGTAGTIILWPIMSGVEVWTDGAARAFLNLAKADYSINFRINKSATNNTLAFTAAGVSVNVGGCAATNQMHVALTWNETDDRVRAYYKGTLRGTATELTAWGANTIGKAYLGSSTLTQWWHSGLLAHVMVLDKEATALEVYQSYALLSEPVRVTVLGDSIPANSASWAYQVADQYDDGHNYIINHGTTNHTIMTNLDAQVSASALDDADIIIIALGTNDDDAGDMEAFQAEVEENLIELKASNPRATVYYMNVLPRWTDNGGSTPVAKGNIRTAIAAACTAQGVTCWDTLTDPWIAANQTSDGLHPTAAGHAAIATRVLALL